MMAYVMAAAVCEKFGSDSICDLKKALRAYNERLRKAWCAR